MSSSLADILPASQRTEILVARHAEVHNPNNIVYGRALRFGLSAHGREQAEAIGRFLDARPVAAIYTSPLLRARQTTEALIAYHPGVPVRRTVDLIEVKSGYEGQPNSILKPGFNFYDPLVNEDDETMEQVCSRVLRLLRRAVKRHAGHTIVAVSHGDPIAIMRLALLGEPLTVKNLHATVYPDRASINFVVAQPGKAPELTYFDIGGSIGQAPMHFPPSEA